MKRACIRFWLVLLVTALNHFAARAFPPAPDGTLYGMARDQYGTPLMNPADTIILQTPGGAQVMAGIQPNLAVGVNFAVDVPMDQGTLANRYTANSLTPGTAFTLYVAVGASTNLPIEMTLTNLTAGNPAFLMRQDLTLGTDVNGTGIPDQWIEAFLSDIGTNISLSAININGIYTKDGLTLKQEYQLGNYPFNPTNNFRVSLVSLNAGSAVLAFTSMTGRSYTAYGSPDLKNWTTLSFTVPAVGPAVQNNYFASSIQPVQIQTVQPTNQPAMQFFRLQLQ